MSRTDSTVDAAEIGTPSSLAITAEPGREPSRWRKQLAELRHEGALALVQRYGLILVFAAVFVFFAVNPQTGDTFLSLASLNAVLADQAVVGLVALAMVLPLIGHYFDLSVAATVGAVNLMVSATIANYSWPVPASLLAGALTGTVIGLVVGYLVAKLRLNAFITTFGVYVLLVGLSEWYTGGSQITNLPPSIGSWGSGLWLGVPLPFWLLLVVSAVLWFVLAHTPYGRYLESIGSNEPAAKLVGINTDRYILLSFVGSGLISGIAGALLTSRLGGGNATSGASFLFPAFAAIFLGATVIRPGKYNVWGTVIAVYFVGFTVSGIILLGADSWVYHVFNGGALVVAVALSTFSGRAHTRRSLRRLEEHAKGSE